MLGESFFPELWEVRYLINDQCAGSSNQVRDLIGGDLESAKVEFRHAKAKESSRELSKKS